MHTPRLSRPCHKWSARHLKLGGYGKTCAENHLGRLLGKAGKKRKKDFVSGRGRVQESWLLHRLIHDEGREGWLNAPTRYEFGHDRGVVGDGGSTMS